MFIPLPLPPFLPLSLSHVSTSQVASSACPRRRIAMASEAAAADPVAAVVDSLAEAADLVVVEVDPSDLAAAAMDLVAASQEFSLCAAGQRARDRGREESPTRPTSSTSPIQQKPIETAPPPPPALVDDVIGDILLRIPPEDPASLLRASLGCKSWRRLLSDSAFVHQYRTFHRTPPVLGFFQELYSKGTWVPQYVPTIQASPVPQPAIAASGTGSPTTSCRIFDCRHGRVLLQTEHQSSLRFTVWDPITGDQKCISLPAHPWLSLAEFSAAVLCAVDGCDHLRCSRGPFLVVIAGVYDSEELDDDEDGGFVAWASFYSSETGVWSASTSINVDYIIDVVLPSFLGRDAIYFILESGERILKYGLVGGVLSVINVPPQDEPNMIFAAVQDGELGAATVEGYSLHLWSWRATDSDGSAIGEWVRCRVIELDVMIPISIGNPSTAFDLAGFAEGTGSIFISANDDLFTFKLKSGQITKMGKRTSDSPIFPFVSFYTPDLFNAVLQVPMQTDLSIK